MNHVAREALKEAGKEVVRQCFHAVCESFEGGQFIYKGTRTINWLYLCSKVKTNKIWDL